MTTPKPPPRPDGWLRAPGHPLTEEEKAEQKELAEQLGTLATFAKEMGSIIETEAENGMERIRQAMNEPTTLLQKQAHEAARRVAGIVAAYQARERAGLDAALSAGIAGLSEAERTWIEADPKRREDLARRLVDEHGRLTARLYEVSTPPDTYRNREPELRAFLDAVESLARQDSKDGERIRVSLRRFWEEDLRLWEECRDTPGTDPADRESLEQGAAPIRAALSAGRLPALTSSWPVGSYGEIDAARGAEVEGAYLWGSVLSTWREEVWTPSRTAPATFRVPGALMSGRGMVAGFFGRKLVGTQSTLSKGGRISALRLDADRTQLELLAPNRKALTDPSPAEIFQAFGEILGNREWRTLQACFCAAHEDEASGTAPAGKFWATPARFAGLLGIPREGGGKGTLARVSKASVRALDESVANLGRVKGTATFKVRGKDLELTFDDLVREDGVTLAERGHKRGRRPAVLYRLNEGLRSLMESRIVSLPREALAAPLDPRTGKQVPQDVWDDAFKIFTLLAGHARSNAARAKLDNPLPWTRKLDGLLTDANLAGAEVPVRKVRARGLERLDDLHRAGFVSFVVDGQGEEAMLRYDLPTVRPSLATIPGRKVVEALSSSSSGKAPRKRRTPPGDKPTGRPPGRTGGA